MKLKSLILGSVAAAGLSTAGFAADLGVLTSLDVCDSLGISGLTISSADNCLAISGKVSYEFNWGDFNADWTGTPTTASRGGVRNVIDNDVAAPTAGSNGLAFVGGQVNAPVTTLPGETNEALLIRIGAPAGTAVTAIVPNVAPSAGGTDNDWNTKVETWLKFVGTASSDFGPASATIKLKSVQHTVVVNELTPTVGGDATSGGAANGNGIFIIDEAFVQVGDTTTIMAGKKGSVANFGDDEPFNWLGLFNSDGVDKGVMFAKDHPKTGGHVIQVVSSLGNGVTVKAGLENLDSAASGAFGGAGSTNAGFYAPVVGQNAAGTLVGVLEYAGEGITAHVTGLAGGVLDGVVEDWAVHAGVTGTFDMFKVRAAGAYSQRVGGASYWNVLGSAEASFDLFKIALSGEANGGTFAGGAALPGQVGAGGSIGAAVTEGVSVNLGARWFDENTNTVNSETYQVAAQLVAAITETISVTGEVGVFGSNKVAPAATDFYGKAELAWKPGGAFESSLAGEVHQNGAYKVTFKASKEFK